MQRKINWIWVGGAHEERGPCVERGALGHAVGVADPVGGGDTTRDLTIHDDPLSSQKIWVFVIEA